jgi:VanZ family protein
LDRSAGPNGTVWRRPCAVAAVAMLGVILALTLLPVGGPGPSGFQWRLFSGEFDLSDFICNILLFLPLTVALRCSGVAAWKTVALGLVLSATIEFAQLRVVPGRDSSLSDLISNTLGGTLGVALAGWLPTRRRSALRGVTAAVLSLAAIAVDGLLQRPSFPEAPYYGQWTANLGMYDWYRGKVLSAEIGGMPLPSRRIADTRAARELLRTGARLRVRAVAGPRTEGLAPLFSIFDTEQREILLVGPDRDGLVLHIRTRAADVLLRTTELRWPRALAGIAPGDALVVSVRHEPSGYCLGLNGQERCRLASTAGQAWTLLQSYPGLAPAAQALLACLTMFLLGIPVGLVMLRERWGWAGLVVAVAGAAVVPPLVGLAPTPLLQLAALVLGVLAARRAP